MANANDDGRWRWRSSPSLALVVASVGSAKPAKSQVTTLKVAVVTDIGGLNDKGFNALANKGLHGAKKQLGVEGRVFISKTAADYIPNLSTAAAGGYDLVIANGFLMGDRSQRSRSGSRTRSSRSSTSRGSRSKGKPKNARGIMFAENEAGYLVGVAGGDGRRRRGTVSSVGGQRPAGRRVHRRLQGGREEDEPEHQGAHRLLAGLRRQDKCKELALNQIETGLRRRLPGRRPAAASAR